MMDEIRRSALVLQGLGGRAKRRMKRGFPTERKNALPKNYLLKYF